MSNKEFYNLNLKSQNSRYIGLILLNSCSNKENNKVLDQFYKIKPLDKSFQRQREYEDK